MRQTTGDVMLFMWFLLNFSPWLYPRSSIANRTRTELDLPESTRAQQCGRVLLSSISWLQVVQLKAVEMTQPTVCQWTRWDMNDNPGQVPMGKCESFLEEQWIFRDNGLMKKGTF